MQHIVEYINRQATYAGNPSATSGSAGPHARQAGEGIELSHEIYVPQHPAQVSVFARLTPDGAGGWVLHAPAWSSATTLARVAALLPPGTALAVAAGRAEPFPTALEE